jgi:RHS repeat-associated protein
MERSERQFPERSDPFQWYFTDPQGSVIRLVSEKDGKEKLVRYQNGSVVNRTEKNDRYEYTGRQFFFNQELQYNRARWYSPLLGRWITPDPLGLGAGDTNLYRYVGNSAPNATDPSGLAPDLWGGLWAMTLPGQGRLRPWVRAWPPLARPEQTDGRCRGARGTPAI